MSLMLVLGLIFVSSIQPMFMIGSLILLVIVYSYMIYMYMGMYWFGYALVMVMLSGVLVVFTYMVSLIPNENFESYNIVYMLSMIVLMGGSYKIWGYGMKYNMVSLELWNSYVSIMNIYMVGFLLMIMLLVVWLSYMGYGAVRGE